MRLELIPEPAVDVADAVRTALAIEVIVIDGQAARPRSAWHDAFLRGAVDRWPPDGDGGDVPVATRS